MPRPAAVHTHTHHAPRPAPPGPGRASDGPSPSTSRAARPRPERAVPLQPNLSFLPPLTKNAFKKEEAMTGPTMPWRPPL